MSSSLCHITVAAIVIVAVALTIACGSDSPTSTPVDGADAALDDATNPADAFDTGDHRDGSTSDTDLDASDDASSSPVDADAPDGDGDPADARDVGKDAEDDSFECDCPVPNTTCAFLYDQFICVLRDVEDCRAEGCPDGFICGIGAHCICSSEVREEAGICEPRCQTHDDCPGPNVCHPDGYCTFPKRCFSTIFCRQGEWCTPIDDSNSSASQYTYCLPPGRKAVGEPCDADGECESVACEGTCVQRCLDSSDCPEGTGCGQDGVCKALSCNTTCPEGSTCDGDRCLPPRCLLTGDCDEGDCFNVPVAGGLGACRADRESYCKANEFRQDNADGSYCRLPIQCGSTLECPASYECVLNNYGLGTPYTTSWCSRRVGGE